MNNQNERIESSFRDPSGFLYRKNGVLYRQINKKYKENYDKLMESGLYKSLTEKTLLIPHLERDINLKYSDLAYKIIQPEELSFISYPYGWCFGELKDAALLTLQIQKISLEHGMFLKDASAYNIQFKKGSPIFIDTLSFEKYKEGQPWIAYKQFCQHFLAPLALMKYRDLRLNQLSKIFIDGIPLGLTSKLLPKRTHLKFPLLTHIHLHSKTQIKYEDKPIDVSTKKISKFQLTALIDNLESFIKNLKLPKQITEWGDYYNNTNYSDEAFNHKKEIINSFIDKIKPKTIWDLGANDGTFSRLASDKGIDTIAFDIDPIAVEKNYTEIKKKKEKHILPLISDLTNPSAGIGWDNKERKSLTERGPADLVMGLALIHHLAISNNTPFEHLASFFSKLGKYMIIEFVPKSDSKVQKLLKTREDIFENYNEEGFEREFGKFFKVKEKVKIKNSERKLYLMKKQ